MDTALILHCPLILETIQNTGKYGNYLTVGIKTAASFVNTDRFLKRISDPICTATARTCQQDCHYCSLLRLSVATTVIILSAHLKVIFMAHISVSLHELYNSQPALCSQTVFHCTHLQTL